MSNTLIGRIEQEIEKSGRSQSAIAIEAFGNESTLRKILNGTTRSPTLKTLTKLANVLQTTPEYLMGRAETNLFDPSSHRTETVFIQKPSIANAIPVLGTAAGSFVKGAFQMDIGVVDYVRRPETLFSARDVYALYVEGSSMEPQYFPGDLIYVNPHKPARSGDPVVVQTKLSGDQNVEATLGIYVRKTEKHICIKKRNPDTEIQILRNDATVIHKVLTMNEIYGA
jgi:phage repressor protein C with HTH and peptisase S24 domain